MASPPGKDLVHVPQSPARVSRSSKEFPHSWLLSCGPGSCCAGCCPFCVCTCTWPARCEQLFPATPCTPSGARPGGARVSDPDHPSAAWAWCLESICAVDPASLSHHSMSGCAVARTCPACTNPCALPQNCERPLRSAVRCSSLKCQHSHIVLSRPRSMLAT